MKLQVPFVQLPLKFNADLLAEEIAALDEDSWRPHPQGYPGNSALPLVSVECDPASDALRGAMALTPFLERCPYLMQVLESLGVTVGRTRLMRLSGQAEVSPHVDTAYYWWQRVRVHVPITTQPIVVDTDPAVVKKNVEGTKEYVRLAHDIGSPGVKVRPNGIPKGADLDSTLRRIGGALHEVGEDAAGFGVEIRVEVHGGTTQLVPNLAKIIRYADHPNVFVCWNSNPTDVVDGSIRENFALVADKIREVHLHDLTDENYPWRDLFSLLDTQRYNGYTLAEIQESADPERVLSYFRSLWIAYQPKPKGA